MDAAVSFVFVHNSLIDNYMNYAAMTLVFDMQSAGGSFLQQKKILQHRKKF